MIITVVGAVLVTNGKVLACRRAPERSSGGKWEFPGGKVEPGETPEQALAREIREELGTEISVTELLDRSSTVVGDQEIELSCYFARVTGRLPTQSTDHDELRWLAAADLAGLDWAKPDLPAVAKLITRLS